MENFYVNVIKDISGIKENVSLNVVLEKFYKKESVFAKKTMLEFKEFALNALKIHGYHKMESNVFVKKISTGTKQKIHVIT